MILKVVSQFGLFRNYDSDLLANKEVAKGTIKVVEKGKGYAYIELLSNEIIVGRHSDSDIVCDDESISRQHCILNKHIIHWTVKNLISTSNLRIKRDGAFLQLISGQFKLERGDEIFLSAATGFIIE